jgi:hypothetical protein
VKKLTYSFGLIFLFGGFVSIISIPDNTGLDMMMLRGLVSLSILYIGGMMVSMTYTESEVKKNG